MNAQQIETAYNFYSQFNLTVDVQDALDFMRDAAIEKLQNDVARQVADKLKPVFDAMNEFHERSKPRPKSGSVAHGIESVLGRAIIHEKLNPNQVEQVQEMIKDAINNLAEANNLMRP